MIVIDASAAIFALLRDDATGKSARAEIAADTDAYAPGVFYGEVLAAITGYAGAKNAGAVKVADAADAIATLAAWDIAAVDSRLLVTRVWELRHNVSSADALYVAAAERLGCPLLTGDARLAAAPGPRCEFSLIGVRPS